MADAVDAVFRRTLNFARLSEIRAVHDVAYFSCDYVHQFQRQSRVARKLPRHYVSIAEAHFSRLLSRIWFYYHITLFCIFFANRAQNVRQQVMQEEQLFASRLVVFAL